jgi:dsRNA-specific ribonuclease
MSEIIEESLYNPFNSKNKTITERGILEILTQYNVYNKINDVELYQRAFIHRSYVNPQRNSDNIKISPKPPDCVELKSDSNERLEFLGDGILENITKFYLYKRFPHQDEGFMTEKKIALVKNDHIGKLAFKMGLNEWYLMSKNAEEKKTRYNFKKLGCLFEAFLGALFLDANKTILQEQTGYFSSYLGCGIGFQVCQIFVESIFEQLVDWNELLENDDNYKNIFQVMVQKEFKTTPEYIVLNIDEEQRYTTGVYLCLNEVNIHNINLNDAISFDMIERFENVVIQGHDFIFFSKATHKIKKKAEQIACQKAIELIHRFE